MNVKISAVTYRYHKQTPYQTQALDRVSFQVGAGEAIGLIGTSGAGKSSLLYCLAGGMKPDSGMIEISHSGNETVKIGLVIQEPEKQFFADTVGEEVTFALKLRGYADDEAQALAELALSQVGYRGNMHSSPFRLSGGEQRRVAIASILVMEPQLLLLDEPTVGMDRPGLDVIRGLIAQYRSAQRAIMIASHDLDFLYPQVDRFLVMQNGKLVADFKKSEFGEVVSSLREYQLGIPEAVALQQRPVPDFIKEFL